MDCNKIKDWILGQDTSSALYWTSIGLGLVVTVTAVVILRRVIKSIRSGNEEERSERNLKLIFIMALAINADAMLRVATDKLGLAWWFAGGVFFFFEILQLHFMRVGKAKYKVNQTTGNAALIVWFVAIASAVITLFNSHNPVEAVIRIVLPVTVAGVWYLNLVADQKPKRGKFRYSPRRIGVLLGVVDPDDDEFDETQAQRDQEVKSLVTLSYRIERGGWLVERRKAKLKRKVYGAKPEITEAAGARRKAVQRALDELMPEDRVTRSTTDAEIEKLLSQIPAKVRPAGTTGTDEQVSGTGTRVRGTGTPGTEPAGTTGMPEVAGTGTTDQVRAWEIVRYADQNEIIDLAKIPVMKLREICAPEGGKMSSQTVAIRCRDLALGIMIDRNNGVD